MATLIMRRPDLVVIDESDGVTTAWVVVNAQGSYQRAVMTIVGESTNTAKYPPELSAILADAREKKARA